VYEKEFRSDVLFDCGPAVVDICTDPIMYLKILYFSNITGGDSTQMNNAGMSKCRTHVVNKRRTIILFPGSARILVLIKNLM
jgi:hypothetical protein